MELKEFSPTILPVQLHELYEDFISDPSLESAQALAQEYFSNFSTHSINKELWRMTAATLSDPVLPNMEQGVQRHNLLFFYEFTLIFIQAAEWLAKEKH